MAKRMVVGICMDKERDKDLLRFLNSKTNKSDYVRNILYETLENKDSIISPSGETGELNTKLLSDILFSLNQLVYLMSDNSLSTQKAVRASQVPTMSTNSNNNSENFDNNNYTNANCDAGYEDYNPNVLDYESVADNSATANTNPDYIDNDMYINPEANDVFATVSNAFGSL